MTTDKNTIAFNKSYFGKKKMAKSNLHTPDRQQVPDDDSKYATCLNCKGKGKTICENDDEDDQQSQDYEKCSECKGEGIIEKEEWEGEW